MDNCIRLGLTLQFCSLRSQNTSFIINFCYLYMYSIIIEVWRILFYFTFQHTLKVSFYKFMLIMYSNHEMWRYIVATNIIINWSLKLYNFNPKEKESCEGNAVRKGPWSCITNYYHTHSIFSLFSAPIISIWLIYFWLSLSQWLHDRIVANSKTFLFNHWWCHLAYKRKKLFL